MDHRVKPGGDARGQIIVLAAHHCARVLLTTTTDDQDHTQQRRGGAPKGATSHGRARRGHGSVPCDRHARLPALHGGACPGEQRQEISPGRASRELKETRRRYPRRHSRLSGAPRAPVINVGGDDARTARERGDKPRPQEPHSLRVQVCLEATPLTSEIGRGYCHCCGKVKGFEFAPMKKGVSRSVLLPKARAARLILWCAICHAQA